ncbi:unnamed protein product [Lampetra fluviatilis]
MDNDAVSGLAEVRREVGSLPAALQRPDGDRATAHLRATGLPPGAFGAVCDRLPRARTTTKTPGASADTQDTARENDPKLHQAPAAAARVAGKFRRTERLENDDGGDDDDDDGEGISGPCRQAVAGPRSRLGRLARGFVRV